MAIPGYTPTVSDKWVKEFALADYSKSSGLWANACEFLNISTSDMSSIIFELIDRVTSSRNVPLVIREDGTIDIGKIYPMGRVPSIFEKLNVIGNVADYNAGMTIAVIDGVWTVLFGEAAVLWTSQMLLPIPTELPVPKLILVDYQYTPFQGLDYSPGSTIVTPTFLATYTTKYGESGPSNTIICPRAEYWTSATLEIEEPHSLALSVNYYRLFDTTFRLVREVIL